jgi:ectoine hydroxylase-related dioxygenase (phytanoyl-CoA dioxygenase family)
MASDVASTILGRPVTVADSVKALARRCKPAWMVRNMLHYPDLRSNAEFHRRYGIRRPVVGPISHRHIKRPAGEVPWLDRPDAREALSRHPDLSSFPEPIQRSLFGWIDNGYMTLPKFFDDAVIDAMNSSIEDLVDRGEASMNPRDRRRVMNPFLQSREVADALTDPELLRLLSFTLGKQVRLFQGMHFYVGSQQDAHSDFFHMSTEPVGFLIAIWIALEDILPGSGPVYYYPGSHKLPYLMSEDLEARSGPFFIARDKDEEYSRRLSAAVREAGIEPVEFVAEKGDVLVWHANLVHGGHPITRDGATRRSLVAHYFARGVLCYHEVTERPAVFPASADSS